MEVMAQAGMYSNDFGDNLVNPFQHQTGICFQGDNTAELGVFMKTIGLDHIAMVLVELSGPADLPPGRFITSNLNKGEQRCLH